MTAVEPNHSPVSAARRQQAERAGRLDHRAASAGVPSAEPVDAHVISLANHRRLKPDPAGDRHPGELVQLRIA